MGYLLRVEELNPESHLAVGYVAVLLITRGSEFRRAVESWVIDVELLRRPSGVLTN